METYKNFNINDAQAYVNAETGVERMHAYAVVESTLLAYTKAPAATFSLIGIKNDQALSSIQEYAVRMGCTKLEQYLPHGPRCAIMISDAPGVGKTREIASIVAEYFLRGEQRHIWISPSKDLFDDANRAFKALHHDSIPISRFSKLKSAHPPINGVVFLTYQSLISERKNKANEKNETQNFQRIMGWLTNNELLDFNGVLVFDECHKGKNCSDNFKEGGSEDGSKIGDVMLKFQKMLPNARIIYSSATCASEPKEFRYLERLDIFANKRFPTFESFRRTMNDRGILGMECLIASLKYNGFLVSRALDMTNVKVQTEIAFLSPQEVEFYNKSCEWWQKGLRLVTAISNLRDDNKMLLIDKKFMIIRQFWGAALKYFRAFILDTKASRIIKVAEDMFKDKNSSNRLVIGIQSTGEGALKSEAKHNHTKDASVTRHIMRNMLNKIKSWITKANTTYKINKQYNCAPPKSRRVTDLLDSSDSDEDSDQDQFENDNDDQEADLLNEFDKDDSIFEVLNKDARLILQQLEHLFIDMKNDFPLMFLENIRRHITPDKLLSELTGRTCALKHENQSTSLGPRKTDTETQTDLNLKQRTNFMDKNAKAVILSDAGSVGLSLHADAGCSNTGRRFHYTVEIPWSGDKMLQQMGRTHRSNQTQEPTYVLLLSNIPGEVRFLSGMNQKLRQLGASIQGDQRFHNSKGFGDYDFASESGQIALEHLLITLTSGEGIYADEPFLPEYKGDYILEAQNEIKAVGLHAGKCRSVLQFLNRLLVIRFSIGIAIFDHFTAIYEDIKRIDESEKDGVCKAVTLKHLTLDYENVRVTETLKIFTKGVSDHTNCQVVKFRAANGWEFAEICREIKKSLKQDNFHGFYDWKMEPNDIRRMLIGVYWTGKHYNVVSPTRKTEILLEKDREVFLKSCITVSDVLAEINWKRQQDGIFSSRCEHYYRQGKCTLESCSRQKFQSVFCLVTGDIHGIFDKLDQSLSQLVPICVSTTLGETFVGMLMKKEQVGTLEGFFDLKK